MNLNTIEKCPIEQLKNKKVYRGYANVCIYYQGDSQSDFVRDKQYFGAMSYTVKKVSGFPVWEREIADLFLQCIDD
jgi:hypothetical protein